MTTGEYPVFVIDKEGLSQIIHSEVVVRVQNVRINYDVGQVVSIKSNPYIQEQDSEFFAHVTKIHATAEKDHLIFLKKIQHLYPQKQSCR